MNIHHSIWTSAAVSFSILAAHAWVITLFAPRLRNLFELLLLMMYASVAQAMSTLRTISQ